MKFTTTTTSLLLLLGLSAAAPTPAAEPAPVPWIPGSGSVITPTAVSQYDVWTGAIRYNVGAGKIFKNNKVTDTSTLLSFAFPAASAGRTCTFHLFLGPASTLTGSPNFDIFSSLQPATASTNSWGPGNQRNNYLGRAQAALNAEAVFLQGYGTAAQSFPCPAAGTTAGYEFVATDDVEDIEWSQAGGVGAYITYV